MNNEEKILQMLTHLTERQDTTEKMLTQMLEDISGLKQGQKNLEQGQAAIEQRVTGIEQSQKSIEKRVTKTELMIENTVIPAIQILKEGQLTIQNQIKRLSVIDAMQDDIATLKTAVKFLSQELDKIQKAM
jgi:predicted  nucleic acid-binding Zn-ribbon protein